MEDNEIEKIDMTKDEFDLRQSWAYCAGSEYAYNSVITYLLSEAGKMFAGGNDEKATLTRNLANDIKKLFHQPESQLLDQFIKGKE